MIRRLFAYAMLFVMSMAVYAEPDGRGFSFSDHIGDLRNLVRSFDLCPPDTGMRLVVESLGEDATRGDLTEEQIRNAAESRLRAARIYDPEADPYLYINVNVGPPEKGSKHFPFYAINVEYKRVLLDPRLPWFRYAATTWDIRSAGEGASNFILSILSQYLDEFLVDYLRVRDSEECQELRAKGRLTKKSRTFDFSTLSNDKD